MQYKESTVHIYYTDDYARFKMMDGNRELNEGKIKRIIEDINAGIDMLRYYPIQVVEKGDRLEIVDGQHRFWICKTLKRPVHFIILKDPLQMHEIAKVNSNVEKWKAKDFIHCYVQLDNKNYIELQDFMDDFGISVSASIKLLSTGSPGVDGHMMNEFQRGGFKAEFVEQAREFAKKAQLFEFFSSWKSTNFLTAVFKIIEAKKVDIATLAKKVEQHKDTVVMKGSFKEYVFCLEEIWNIKKREREYLT